MGRVIGFLFFSLLVSILFYLFEKKPPSPRPPDYSPVVQTPIPRPGPITIDHINMMRKLGVRVQFPSERKSHLLSTTTLPRDLLQVELLKLSGSSLYNVPPWLKRFTNLRYLDLSENNLDADNDLLETLQAMPKLDVLNLSNNPLFKSKSSQNVSLAPVWQILNSLGELYLSDTQGTAKNYGSLAALRALQRLDLSNNRIGDDVAVLELNKLYVLDILNLSHNGLTQFPGQYLPMSQLRALNVSHNNLTKIPYFEMSQLEVLYLQGNGAVSMVDNYGDSFCLLKLRILWCDSGSKIPQELKARVETVQEDSSAALQKKIQDAITRLQQQRTPKYSQEVTIYPPSQNQEKRIGHYIIRRNGTVIDISTGLMWKRCPEGLSGVNCENGNANTYTWDDAIQRFRYGSSYAGYSDWRMPTVNELETLIAQANSTQVFPATLSKIYWSGTLDPYLTDSAWYINFRVGRSHYDYRSKKIAVRLVRKANPTAR